MRAPIHALYALSTVLFAVPGSAQDCLPCHEKLTPGIVADWRTSKHAAEDVSCAFCHGTKHTSG